jgi:hypothetical protein
MTYLGFCLLDLVVIPQPEISPIIHKSQILLCSPEYIRYAHIYLMFVL